MAKRLEELLLKMNQEQIETLAETFRNSRMSADGVPTGDHDEVAIETPANAITEDNFDATLEELNW